MIDRKTRPVPTSAVSVDTTRGIGTKRWASAKGGNSTLKGLHPKYYASPAVDNSRLPSCPISSITSAPLALLRIGSRWTRRSKLGR